MTLSSNGTDKDVVSHLIHGAIVTNKNTARIVPKKYITLTESNLKVESGWHITRRVIKWFWNSVLQSII